eukprot:tig00000246_g21499.t1
MDAAAASGAPAAGQPASAGPSREAHKAARVLANVFLVALLDLTSAGILVPLLPAYAEQEFGATSPQIGVLLGTYAAAQLVGNPIAGRVSDRRGRKSVMLVCLAGVALGYALLASATSLSALFAARALAGLLGANSAVAQAYISDHTGEADRARGLGLLGAAFGIGFVVGPALGGALGAHYGYRVPALVAAGLSAANVLLAASLLPASRPAAAASPAAPAAAPHSWRSLRAPAFFLLAARLVFGLSFYAFRTAFPLFARHRLGLDAKGTGYLLSYLGLLVGAVQGKGVGRAAKRWPEPPLVLASCLALAASLQLWGSAATLRGTMLALIPLAAANGMLMTCINSLLTKVVPKEDVGLVLGLSAAADSVAKAAAPPAAGVLIASHGQGAPVRPARSVPGPPLRADAWGLAAGAAGCALMLVDAACLWLAFRSGPFRAALAASREHERAGEVKKAERHARALARAEELAAAAGEGAGGAGRAGGPRRRRPARHPIVVVTFAAIDLPISLANQQSLP